MSIGLQAIGRVPQRELREEFTTYTDPFVEDAMRRIFPPGDWNKMHGFSRSYYSRVAHIESILRYDKPTQNAPDNHIWTTVVRENFEYFSKLPKVSALSALQESDSFKKVRYHQGTSAGYGYSLNPSPHPTHKGPLDGPNAKKARGIAARIVHTCAEAHAAGKMQELLQDLPRNSVPDVAFTRTQLAELPNMKVRNVFGECFHYVILEGLFAQPLIEMFIANDTFYFIGEDPIEGVPRLIQSFPDEPGQYITFDWSGFDASAQVYEIEHAFELLESLLVFPDHTTKLVFDYMRTLFISRKLASPDGRLFLRYGGVPSGSYFTHIIDSIINWMRIRYLFAYINVPLVANYTHGDDGIVIPSRRLDNLDDIIEEANRRLWTINPFKSKLVHDYTQAEFLGRTSRSGVSYRDSDKTLRLLLYPEYPVTDPQISIARLKGIDTDSGHRVRHLPEIYHFLNRVYGDTNAVLPRKFRRFNLTELYSQPLGI